VINFLIVALAVFFVAKGINRLHRQQPAAAATPATPPRSELLLEEIRDAVKQRAEGPFQTVVARSQNEFGAQSSEIGQ